MGKAKGKVDAGAKFIGKAVISFKLVVKHLATKNKQFRILWK